MNKNFYLNENLQLIILRIVINTHLNALSVYMKQTLLIIEYIIGQMEYIDVLNVVIVVK